MEDNQIRSRNPNGSSASNSNFPQRPRNTNNMYQNNPVSSNLKRKSQFENSDNEAAKKTRNDNIGSLKLPGTRVPHYIARTLRETLKTALNSNASGFPGSQPVSFQKKHFDDLMNENFFVCEKSDGTRALMLITFLENKQQVFMVDRHNNFWNVPNIIFPLPFSDPHKIHFHNNTVIDGEYICDTESDGTNTYRYMAFDLLSVNGKNCLEKPLDKRLGHLHDFVFKPYTKFLSISPSLKSKAAFSFEMKYMEFSYGLVKVLDQVIPKLKHKNDGLIFTSVSSPYVIGSCEKILKWKPADENSVDFKLSIEKNDSDSDLPIFRLLVWKGKDIYDHFGYLDVSEEEWKSLSQVENLDQSIIEVTVDKKKLPDLVWKFMRIRDDKPNGNFIDIVYKIISSIRDGVTAKELKDIAPNIRTEWKNRQKNSKPGQT
ncbi:hypothetical protein BB560_001147 [Smittium megazygosporum]|uniref:mRNA-capping enzyme subunit alpha n=1 Tax=Smittium megazygosporum TaxID=133381 RepID=A0A2T9ZIE0_9FUNG|nr:hypothetical protein BB560_001147 [Smittium megazygosporum]